MNDKFVVLIPCSGDGLRFGGDTPKQYCSINGITIVEHTINVFLKIESIDKIVIVSKPNDNFIKPIVNNYSHHKVSFIAVGGDTRASSVLNGLNCLNLLESDWVLVHDAVRCCIDPQLIKTQISLLKDDLVGGILAIPAIDTIKYVVDNDIQKTIDRNKIFLAQTPQMFRYGILKTALEKSNLNDITDEAQAVELSNSPVKIVLGSPDNIKITLKEDLIKAQLLLNKK